MNQLDVRQLLAQINKTTPSFFLLNWRQKMAIVFETFRLNTRLIFSNRFIWFLLGLLAWCIFQYVINYQREIYQRMSADYIFFVVMQLPLSAFAVFLNMSLISSEKDNRTLEITFTTAGSRYKVWLVRFGSLCVLFFLLSLTLSYIGYYFFVDLPVWAMAFHAYVPTFFISGMVFYFAVKLRSGLAAGMVSGILLFFMFIFNEPLRSTRYALYFNPFTVPHNVDSSVWYDWTWQNRIGLIVLGGLFIFAALRGMGNREKLLR
ncbi:MAG: hypothetical protein H6696_13215 [Deferribacteres bacterium]|nr:hypothetical protein [candidate division KSB1 bacterium]MCB9502890.1 hypothetical protein [Deferribacteres bacterium]